MPSPENEKEQLINHLLESLHYGNKSKEDIAIIEQLRGAFNIPQEAELSAYLIKEVDFSDLFAKLLEITEPFAQMVNDIYSFLADKKTTARSLQHLIVGESIKDNVSFDLESFPQVYQPVIQQIQDYRRIYDLEKVLNTNISPLSWAEGLLSSAYCTAPDYQKAPECTDCNAEMIERFQSIFQRYDEMLQIIPDEVKNKIPYQYMCGYFEESRESFNTGDTSKRYSWNQRCHGYEYWQNRLEEIERQFDLVSNKQIATYDVTVLLRFFELPFWKERNRLYEVWTLIHLLHLLRGVSVDLNIKDNKWYLVYGDSSEPIAWLRGHNFEVEVWYQHKLKAGLKTFESAPVEPEMLLIYRGKDNHIEPLVLIECKERKDYDVREIYKLSAFYRTQVNAALNIFCNYYDYAPQTGIKVSIDKPAIIICDQFRPYSPIVPQVDQTFIEFMKDKIGVFLQTLLIDVSGSMRGKDIEGVYKELDEYLSRLPGSRTLSGFFADRVEFFEPEDFLEMLQVRLSISGGTQFGAALRSLYDELLKANPDTAVINFYVITDVDFDFSDWDWIKGVDVNASYNITFVARKDWLSNASMQNLKELTRVNLLTF